MTYEEAHRRARELGPSPLLYRVARALLAPFFRLWFRLEVFGAEHIPATGAAVLTPNHKSFWDAFFIGMATGRHVRFMGKAELFEAPYGPLLVALGAFPVRRGQSDAVAHETAHIILERGGLLSLFPEGTRMRDPDELGAPRRGAVRLAIETGAPLVPAAITGTERLWVGPVPRPRRVRLAFAEPVPVSRLEATPEIAGQVLAERVWPEVEAQFRWLRSRRGLVAGALAALGVGGATVRGMRAKRRRASRWGRLRGRLRVPRRRSRGRLGRRRRR